MRSDSPHRVTNHLKESLRKKQIEELFRAKRQQILQQQMIEYGYAQKGRERQTLQIEQQKILCGPLDNIGYLATLYNDLREGKYSSLPQRDIEIFLETIIRQIQYWIAMRQLRQSEGFLFLLVLIFKTLATLTQQPDRYINQLMVSSQFLGVDGRIKDLLCVGQLKAISC